MSNHQIFELPSHYYQIALKASKLHLDKAMAERGYQKSKSTKKLIFGYTDSKKHLPDHWIQFQFGTSGPKSMVMDKHLPNGCTNCDCIKFVSQSTLSAIGEIVQIEDESQIETFFLQVTESINLYL